MYHFIYSALLCVQTVWLAMNHDAGNCDFTLQAEAKNLSDTWKEIIISNAD